MLAISSCARPGASFYQNPGVDGWAILRTVWIDLRGGEILSRGSTLTQQRARNLLVSPLILRDLLDNALPNKDVARLNCLALGLFGLTALTGLIQVAQGYLSSAVGEGIICDLRKAL